MEAGGTTMNGSAPRILPSRLLWGLTLGIALAMPAGCSRPSGATDGGAPMSASATVPAPEKMVAEIFLPAPEKTWGKARTVLGGSAMFLPAGFGAFVTSLLGLPITVAQEIDGAVPVVGVVVD